MGMVWRNYQFPKHNLVSVKTTWTSDLQTLACLVRVSLLILSEGLQIWNPFLWSLKSEFSHFQIYLRSFILFKMAIVMNTEMMMMKKKMMMMMMMMMMGSPVGLIRIHKIHISASNWNSVESNGRQLASVATQMFWLFPRPWNNTGLLMMRWLIQAGIETTRNIYSPHPKN